MELTREAFLEATASLGVEKVPLPYLGDDAHVYVRKISATESPKVRELAAAQTDGKLDEARAQASWCVLGVCNSQGQPLFTEADIEALMAGQLVPIQHCAVEVMRFNGITEEAEAERKKE